MFASVERRNFFLLSKDYFLKTWYNFVWRTDLSKNIHSSYAYYIDGIQDEKKTIKTTKFLVFLSFSFVSFIFHYNLNLRWPKGSQSILNFLIVVTQENRNVFDFLFQFCEYGDRAEFINNDCIKWMKLTKTKEYVLTEGSLKIFFFLLYFSFLSKSIFQFSLR